MSWARCGLILGALAAQVLPVAAADMPRDELPPPVYRPEPKPIVSWLSGWYLRGDVGYAWGTMGGADSSAGIDPTDNKLGGSFVGGVGAGIKTEWLRTDVTLDYTAPLKYQGTIVGDGDTTAKVSAITALFNGYLDLGTWYRATPYIGAGAGAARVNVSDFVRGVPAFTGDSSHAQWKFAWAVMGGVGYRIAPNMLVDLGYRYVNFGDVTTASDALGSLTLKNIAAHEVRVGLRWSFDDLPYTR
ncbi:MAG: outer membrane protein [Pseudolabrys sp.]